MYLSGASVHSGEWMDESDLLDPVPADFRETAPRLAADYDRCIQYALSHIGSGRSISSNAYLEGLAEEMEVKAEGPAFTVWGGGQNVPDDEFQHSRLISGELAQRLYARFQKPVTVPTGSGGGVMEGAHLGPKDTINGNAHTPGFTLSGIIPGETPGPHNDVLVVHQWMRRRLEMFVRVVLALVIHRGGVGTREEEGYRLGIAADERNRDSRLPTLLSEPDKGTDTQLARVLQFYREVLGRQFVDQHVTLQQGDDFGPLDEIVKSMEIDPNGYWNRDLHIPAILSESLPLTPNGISRIDLTDPQDDRVRFLGHLRWFMNLITQLVVIHPDFLEQNGPAVVRISRDVQTLLEPLLQSLWDEGRVRTRKRIDEVVQWDTVG